MLSMYLGLMYSAYLKLVSYEFDNETSPAEILEQPRWRCKSRQILGL
jgi:hypothetical protein